MSRRIHIAQNAAALATKAADIFCDLTIDAIARNGRFTVSLSGGSTPRMLYEVLASDDHRQRVDWCKVECFFGDERCVPPDHGDSNFRMAHEALLSKVPARVHRIKGETTPKEAAELYEAELGKVFGTEVFPSFDLVLLGVGADGHTASLFPGTSAVSEKKRLAVPVYAKTHGNWRVTLTLPVINNASQVVFLISGEEKSSILKEIFLHRGKQEPYPAALVNPSKGETMWLLDEASAKNLFRQS